MVNLEGITRRDFILGSLAGLGAVLIDGPEALAYPTVPEGQGDKVTSRTLPRNRTVCHRDITFKIAELYCDSFSSSQLARDLNNDRFLFALVHGSIDEDAYIAEDRNLRFVEHFFNPDRQPGKRGLIIPPLNDGSLDSLSRAKKLWQGALALYFQDRKEEASLLLGRFIHLFEDSAAPDHVYLVNHGPRAVKINKHTGKFERLHHISKSLPEEPGFIVVSTSPYEDYCKRKLLDLDGRLIPVHSIEQAFTDMANASLKPNGSIRTIFERNYVIGESGNGHYVRDTVPESDSDEIINYIIPLAIGRGAGLLKLFNSVVAGDYREFAFGSQPLLEDGALELISLDVFLHNPEVYRALVQEAIDLVSGQRRHLYTDSVSHSDDVRMTVVNLLRVVNIPESHGKIRSALEKDGVGDFRYLRREFDKAVDALIAHYKQGSEVEKPIIKYMLEQMPEYIGVLENVYHATLPVNDYSRIRKIEEYHHELIKTLLPAVDTFKCLEQGAKANDYVKVGYQVKELMGYFSEAKRIISLMRDEVSPSRLVLPVSALQYQPPFSFSDWKSEVQRKVGGIK